MDELLEYARFPTLEEANKLIANLEDNGFAFRIDDKRKSLVMVSNENPFENQVFILVRKEDLDRINSLQNDPAADKRQVSFDHFLHTFSDEDGRKRNKH